MTDAERNTLSDDQRAVLDDYAEYLCNDCGGERTCGYCETLRTLADALTQLARSRASEAQLAEALRDMIDVASEYITNIGQCERDVGLCVCALSRRRDAAQAVLDAATAR